MAKEPVPGKVKTRLQPRLSPDESAALYACFLQDRIGETRDLPDTDVAVAYTPPGAADTFTSLVPNSFRLFPQRGATLTGRLAAVTASAFADGYRYVVIMDSDSPDLPRERIPESFALLEGGADVVFGPCRDGGYYLVGLRENRSGIFEEIPWSGPEVLQESLARAASLGLTAALLEPWQDIDTFEDLQDLALRQTSGEETDAAPCAKTMEFLAAKGLLPPRGGA
jgi:rSAM/selenodomain-associated transferase 1